ncbi:hypothetical protein Acr_28g0012340 [Actinidia rufa]|uniref:Uncharacterized protein n=1 Tax=Actinidia rufa TaxID=165716 RepID=A0A7J0HBW3_9ERIC|nr:hypothetical protein Acr_28g0012340 [Actinidia rufa]
MTEAITSQQNRGGEVDTSKGKKDKTRVVVSPIETQFTRVDVTVADSGERLDIGEHSMEHEVGDLKGMLREPRGNMLVTVNSMVHMGQQGKLSFQLKVLDKGKPKDRKPKNNCFICDELHFFRDCQKMEELLAHIKECEERSKETVEDLEELGDFILPTIFLTFPKMEEPQRPPQKPVGDRGQECMEYVPQAETVMEFTVHGST